LKGLPVIAGSLFFWSPRMRALILIAGAALAVAACSSNDNANNAMNADANLSADSIVSNDVTAIDAVTGADANMAADVNYLNEGDDGTNGEGNASASRTSAKSPTANAATSIRPPDEPAPATQNTGTASNAF
jgi:hypothetical protein